MTGQISLTYDMTFVILLLSGLYEPPTRKGTTRCHSSCAKQPVRKNAITEYAADMNVFLAYYKCEDDWKDEKKLLSFLYGKLLREKEKRRRRDGTGRLTVLFLFCMSFLKWKNPKNRMLIEFPDALERSWKRFFAYREDMWEPVLQNGIFLGKFIYLMDAYDDVEDDVKKEITIPFPQGI